MLTKAEFVVALKDTLPEVFETKVSAEKAYDAFCKVLTKGVVSEQGVRLPNVGAFSVYDRPERTGRNPQTGQPMTIPALKVVKFSPAKALMESVNK